MGMKEPNSVPLMMIRAVCFSSLMEIPNYKNIPIMMVNSLVDLTNALSLMKNSPSTLNLPSIRGHCSG